jgi:hypothetical protein
MPAPCPRPVPGTWYLVTNLPLPTTTRAREHPALPAADLTEVVRLSGVRQGVAHGDKPVKQELGWADFPVRSERAIRRHWALVCCAFCFCWWAAGHRERAGALAPALRRADPHLPLPHEPEAGEKCAPAALASRAHRLLTAAIVAPRATAGAGLA